MIFFAQLKFGLLSVFMYAALMSSSTGEHHLKHPSSTPIEALVIQYSRSSETSPPPGGERYAIGADRGKDHAAKPGVDA